MDSAEFNVQRDSMMRFNGVSENISPNPNQRMTSEWTKRIRPARTCKDGISCNGKLKEDVNNLRPCMGSFNCENKIPIKTFKRSRSQGSRKNVSPAPLFSGLKRMIGVLARKSPCPAGNSRCERKEARLTSNKISYRCPTGLWCPKTRDRHRAATDSEKLRITEDTSAITTQDQARSKLMRSSGSAQRDTNPKRTKQEPSSFDGILSAAKQCPYGLWCSENDNSKKNEDDGKNVKGSLETEESKAKNDDASTKLKDLKQNQGEENCPIGLWCSAKRAIGFESSATLEQCPPGLWCKRNGIKIIKDPLTKPINKKHDDEWCPTGFRCSFKREEGYENFESLHQCPPGLWCKRDEIKSEDELNSETFNQCPPGLWCKRSVARDGSTFKEQSTTLRKEDYCSTGPWCAVKRNVANTARGALEQCPPGLWCKRYTAKIKDASTEQDEPKSP